jgi:hypothetical protein
MYAYLVAFSAMLFSALSALTLFTAVRHFDPPEAPAPPAARAAQVAASGAVTSHEAA